MCIYGRMAKFFCFLNLLLFFICLGCVSINVFTVSVIRNIPKVGL